MFANYYQYYKEKLKFGPFWKSFYRKLYLPGCVVSVNLLSIICGIIITWNMPKSRMVSKTAKIWLYSILPLCAIPSPMLYTFIAQKYGKKSSLLFIALPLCFAYVLMMLDSNLHPETGYVARGINGFALGGIMTIVPSYIYELSDAAGVDHPVFHNSHRVFVALGALINYASGMAHSPSVGVIINALVLALVSTFLMLLICFLPETPHYLIAKKRELRAKDVLIKLRNYSMIDDEFRMMCDEIAGAPRKSNTLPSMWLHIFMHSLKVCSSANIIFFFARDIFEYMRHINGVFKPLWKPVSVDAQLMLVGGTNLLLFAIVAKSTQRLERRTIVLATMSCILVFGLIPSTVYFKMINADAKLVAAKNCTTQYIVPRNRAHAYRLLISKKLIRETQLTTLSQNVRWTCWIPAISFVIILSLSNAFGAALERFDYEERQLAAWHWLAAVCDSWSWMLWFVCTLTYQSLDSLVGPTLIRHGQNTIWIWFSLCTCLTTTGVFTAFFYIPIGSDKH